ncbi:SEC-C metal-binding domain-containing protein [Nocardiopsis listeri]|uniref:SEC-C metal-binding domain-containing protein n=1 Tax=Nocardiopsis listeri TaxID=53440 RepID=UPI00083308A7|nr:SEC-C metal-binding domain-containing protein [Nocardiopsis listeri]
MTEPAYSAPLPPRLVAAILDMDLPQHLLDDLAQSPDQTGDILLGAAAELRERRPGLARRVLDLLREHAPEPDYRQYATHMLAGLLRSQGAVAEADGLIDELMDPGVLGRPMAAVLADEFAADGDLDRALYCYNIACRSILAEPVELLERMDPVGLLPLMGRAQVRERLGLPADEHDRAVRAVDQARPSLEEEMGLLAEPVEVDPDARVVLTGRAREHYAGVERALREGGNGQRIVLADQAEIDAYAGEHGLDPAAEETRNAWARTLPQDRAVSWPPERNRPCWCGSGRKYKKCCGSPSVR